MNEIKIFKRSREEAIRELENYIWSEISNTIKHELELLQAMEKRACNIYDLASRLREKELMQLFSSRRRKKFYMMMRAIIKMKDGTYGLCEDCGEPIALKRLKAIPYATLCFSCQLRKER